MPDPTPSPAPAPATPPIAPKQNAVMAFLGSQAFHSFYHAALSGGVTFVMAHPLALTSQWACGLTAAVLGGIVGWLNGGQ